MFVRKLAVLWLSSAPAGCSDDTPASRADQSTLDAAAFTGCPAGVAHDLDGLDADSDAGLLGVSLVSATPAKPSKFENTWRLRVDAAGDPVDDAEVIRVITHMPLHGHDGRPASTVEAADAPGEFLGTIHFMMRGSWEVQLDIASPSAGDDHVVFRVCVEQ